METVNRFKEKQEIDEATKAQVDLAGFFGSLVGDPTEPPLWMLVTALQSELAKTEHRKQHLGYIVNVSKEENSVAVLWQSQVRGAPQTFLSVQATKRDIPVLHEIIPSEILDEYLAMIQDINSNDTGVASGLVQMAIDGFKEHLVTCLDGDPEQNHYLLQAYTKDRKWLLDIQVYYDVIQDDLQHQSQ
jgi:hypothetical protein